VGNIEVAVPKVVPQSGRNSATADVSRCHFYLISIGVRRSCSSESGPLCAGDGNAAV
jgi:hypothetical protein